MQENVNTAEANTGSALFISRLKMVALLGTFIFPLLLAVIWLQFAKSTGKDMGLTSRGQLIAPAVPLEAFSLQDAGEQDFNLDSVRGLWTMLYAPVGECGETCELNLYHMRQVRLALNHRMDRVQRALVLETEGQVRSELLSEHPGLHVLSGERESLMAQVRDAQQGMEALKDAIYLIDPMGNLMMRFPPDLPPKSMLKDVKHLLKVSRIG